MGFFNSFKEVNSKTKMPSICLSLRVSDYGELEEEILRYWDDCQIIEWCVDGFSDVEKLSKDEFTKLLLRVKKLCRGKKLIIDYKGDEVLVNRFLRWSMEKADIVDVDWENTQLERLIREARRKRTKVLISYHNFDHMLSRNEIAETYLRLERLGGDILKIACMANTEADTYDLLEGASAYSQLGRSKPIVAIAMGEEGQVSRICAGDFGSTISYSCGRIKTAPGQFNAKELKKYMDRYYKERL